MHHSVAQRLNEDYWRGFSTTDGATFDRARVYKGEVQISDGGDVWHSVDWRSVKLTCQHTGVPISFMLEIAEEELFRVADYYVVASLIVAFLCFVSVAWMW